VQEPVRFGETRERIAIMKKLYYLPSSRAKNAKWLNCKRVLSWRSQLLHGCLFLFSQAKLRSTTQRPGIAENLCSSLRLAICSVTFRLNILYPLPKGLAYMAIICEQAFNLGQASFSALQDGTQRPFVIGHLGCLTASAYSNS
jgi:hypothetical protein